METCLPGTPVSPANTQHPLPRCPHPTSRAAGLAYSQWLALAILGLVVLTRFIRDTIVMDILVHTTWITTCTPHTQTHTHTTQDSIENIHLTTNSVLLSNNLTPLTFAAASTPTVNEHLRCKVYLWVRPLSDDSNPITKSRGCPHCPAGATI